jgi:hypothetical protein
MQYALLIYTSEPTAPPSPDEIESVMSDYNAYTESIRTDGSYVAGEALHPTVTATTVRVRDGQVVTTDGPFAETKEALGGFYIIEAADLDAAIASAARIPGARVGSIEVRPIVDWSDPTGAGTGEAVGSATN